MIPNSPSEGQNTTPPPPPPKQELDTLAILDRTRKSLNEIISTANLFRSSSSSSSQSIEPRSVSPQPLSGTTLDQLNCAASAALLETTSGHSPSPAAKSAKSSITITPPPLHEKLATTGLSPLESEEAKSEAQQLQLSQPEAAAESEAFLETMPNNFSSEFDAIEFGGQALDCHRNTATRSEVAAQVEKNKYVDSEQQHLDNKISVSHHRSFTIKDASSIKEASNQVTRMDESVYAEIETNKQFAIFSSVQTRTSSSATESLIGFFENKPLAEAEIPQGKR